MTESATGIILRTRPLTETSLIVNWLTPEFGRVSTAAKGARRPKSPFLGKLDLFYKADFTFDRSRRSDLHALREVKLREMHTDLRKDIHYIQQAAYCAALIEQTTEADTPLPAIFALMDGFLSALSKLPLQPQTVFAFELKLLDELGQLPDIAESKLMPGTKQIMEKLASLDWQSLSRLRPSEAQVREMQQFLHGFLIFHLGRIPKGRTSATS